MSLIEPKPNLLIPESFIAEAIAAHCGGLARALHRAWLGVAALLSRGRGRR